MKIGDKAVYWPQGEGYRKLGRWFVNNEGVIIGEGRFEDSDLPYWIIQWKGIPKDETFFTKEDYQTGEYKRYDDVLIIGISKEWVKSPEEAAALML